MHFLVSGKFCDLLIFFSKTSKITKLHELRTWKNNFNQYKIRCISNMFHSFMEILWHRCIQKKRHKQRSNDIDLCIKPISFTFEMCRATAATTIGRIRKQVYLSVTSSFFTVSFFCFRDGCRVCFVRQRPKIVNGIMSFLLCNMVLVLAHKHKMTNVTLSFSGFSISSSDNIEYGNSILTVLIFFLH